jgi:hypothetical protein
VLPLGCTPQGIDYTGKFNQQAIPSRFDDTAPVLSNFWID